MTITFSQFFSILRARWWVAAIVALGVVALTLVVSLLLTERFTATASVVVDSRPDPVASMTYGSGVSPAFIATQVDIINSQRVALKVVRNLRLADNPDVRAQWAASTGSKGSVEQWLAGSIAGALEVTPSRDSNVIYVAYTAQDPTFAAAIANAFVRAYVETSLELRTDPAKQFNTFFDVRTKEARETMEQAQAKLSAFQREKGIIATDERFDIENSRLNELSSQLVAVEAVAAESRSRQAQAAGASADRLTDVLNNSVVSSLRADLSRQEVRLQEMGSRFGEAHPQVRELKINIAELQDRVATETRRVTGSVGVTNTINRSREAQTRAELESQRSKVLRLKAVRDEGQVLARDVDSAVRTFEALQGRLTQTSLESQTTRGSVNVLSPADAPISASFPRIPLFTLVSVLVGVFLAVGTVLLLELLDRRIRTPEDVLVALQMPVIGFMPKPGAKRRLGGGKRLSLMQQRVLGLPLMSKGG